MAVILCIIIVLLFAGWLYLTVWHRKSSFVTYVYHWDYRVLRNLRDMYCRGLHRTPPDSYDFFKTEAIGFINKYLSEHKALVESPHERITKAQKIADMLESQQYIHYYFNEDKAFTRGIYDEMLRDYRSGQYLTKDYFAFEALRKKMPIEIASNEKAFHDFWKFVQAGWFDETTGMYCNIDNNGKKINHNQIGRAIVLICQRNRIATPSKVFAPLWAEPKDEENIEKMRDKIRGWYRPDQIKDADQLDKIVLGILNSD